MAEARPLRTDFFIDETAVETRVATRKAGRLINIAYFSHISPAEARPRAGDLFLARVTKNARGAGGVFVDLGAGGEGFLRIRNLPPEGSLVAARVTRAAYRSKLATLTSESTQLSDETERDSRPRRLSCAPGAVAVVLGQVRPGDSIIVDGDRAWRMAVDEVRRASPQLEDSLQNAPAGLFEREDIEAEIEAALHAVVPLRGGGRLVIEETEAVTVIDVDTANASRAEEVNIRAASEIPFQVALRRLAGTILVDFARIGRSTHLAPLRERLKASAKAIGLELETGVASRTGLLEMRRPRAAAPLAAQLTRAGLTHSAVPVEFNLEARTAKLARAVRVACARVPGPLRVRAAPDLADWLKEGAGRPSWAAVCAVTPALLNLEPDGAIGPDGVEIERAARDGQ